MQDKFNRNLEIRGGTLPTDYDEHLNQLKMDFYDDLKIPIESN